MPLFALGEHECHTSASPRKPEMLISRPLPQDMPSEEADIESSPTLPQPPASPLPEDVPQAEEQLPNTMYKASSPAQSSSSPEGLRRRLSSRSQADGSSTATKRHGGSASSSFSSPASRHKTLAEMEQDEEPESGYVTLLNRLYLSMYLSSSSRCLIYCHSHCGHSIVRGQK